MRYTRRQRKRIYLDALELLAEADFTNYIPSTKRQNARYVCKAISQATGGEISHDEVPDEFPEIYAFRSIEGCPDWAWLSELVINHTTRHAIEEAGASVRTAEGNQLRQLALIFAAELCDDPDFLA